MSIAAEPTARHAARRRADAARVSLPRVVHSEWIKFRSLRSSLITLGVAVLMIVALGVTLAAFSSDATSDTGGGGPQTSTDPTDISLGGISMAQLVVAVLGVLFMAGEYTTGMIRSSLSAVPRRTPVLWGKVLAFTAVTFTTMLLAVTVAFLAGQAVIGDGAASLTDDGVLRVLLGCAGYLTTVGVIGIALGALLRNTAAGITVVVGILLVLPVVAGLLPDSWSDTITPYLPSNAGAAFTTTQAVDGSLSATGGALVLAGYVTALLAAAAVQLRRRDV